MLVSPYSLSSNNFPIESSCFHRVNKSNGTVKFSKEVSFPLCSRANDKSSLTQGSDIHNFEKKCNPHLMQMPYSSPSFVLSSKSGYNFNSDFEIFGKYPLQQNPEAPIASNSFEGIAPRSFSSSTVPGPTQFFPLPEQPKPVNNNSATSPELVSTVPSQSPSVKEAQNPAGDSFLNNNYIVKTNLNNNNNSFPSTTNSQLGSVISSTSSSLFSPTFKTMPATSPPMNDYRYFQTTATNPSNSNYQYSQQQPLPNDKQEFYYSRSVPEQAMFSPQLAQPYGNTQIPQHAIPPQSHVPTRLPQRPNTYQQPIEMSSNIAGYNVYSASSDPPQSFPPQYTIASSLPQSHPTSTSASSSGSPSQNILHPQMHVPSPNGAVIYGTVISTPETRVIQSPPQYPYQAAHFQATNPNATHILHQDHGVYEPQGVIPGYPNMAPPTVGSAPVMGGSEVMIQPNSHLINPLQTKSQTKTQKHVCKICGRRFTRPSSLKTHTYTHTGEKPFRCDVESCGRYFSVVSNLRRHKKIHKAGSGQQKQEQHDMQPQQYNLPDQYQSSDNQNKHLLQTNLHNNQSPHLASRPNSSFQQFPPNYNISHQ